MLIKVDYVNATKGWCIGEDPPHEPFTDNLGELYRFAVKEWGRCVSKVYVDGPDGKHIPCGWVFVKRRRYDDCAETFLAETWVTLLEAPDTVTRTPHYFDMRARRARGEG